MALASLPPSPFPPAWISSLAKGLEPPIEMRLNELVAVKVWLAFNKATLAESRASERAPLKLAALSEVNPLPLTPARTLEGTTPVRWAAGRAVNPLPLPENEAAVIEP